MKKLILCMAALYAPLAGAAYKCVDEKGVTHIGDTPPAGCANVVMYETSPGGMTLRKIEPMQVEAARRCVQQQAPRPDERGERQ